jgi:hypothetical protein
MPLATNGPPGTGKANATRTNPSVASTGNPPTVASSPRKRAWNPQYLASLSTAAEGDPIRFELVNGEWASGTIQHAEHKNNELTYISGVLTGPEEGKFFFQKQSMPGKAGDFVGVVEFPKSQRAFRLEPTGPNGATELVEHALNEVLCVRLLPAPADDSTNDVEEIPPLKPNDFPQCANSRLSKRDYRPGKFAGFDAGFVHGFPGRLHANVGAASPTRGRA